jgi:hypothetical protein
MIGVNDAFQERRQEVMVGTRCKIRSHGILSKERAAVINNCPSDPHTHLFCVGFWDGEALLVVKDAVDFQQLFVVITVIPEEGPEEGAVSPDVQLQIHVC